MAETEVSEEEVELHGVEEEVDPDAGISSGAKLAAVYVVGGLAMVGGIAIEQKYNIDASMTAEVTFGAAAVALFALAAAKLYFR